MDKEKDSIKNFISSIINKSYAEADKFLQNAVEEKLKSKIREEISPTEQKNSQE